MTEPCPEWPMAVLSRAHADALLPRMGEAQAQLDALRLQCLLPFLEAMFEAAPEVAALSCTFDESDQHATRLEIQVDVLAAAAGGAPSGLHPLGTACFYLEEGSARQLDQLQDMLNGVLTSSPSWGVRRLLHDELVGRVLSRGDVEAFRRATAGEGYDVWRAGTDAVTLDENLPASSLRPHGRRL